MNNLDDIQWNELPIIARLNGELSVWKAWKRSIAAFNDPQMWRDTSKFADYFERLEDGHWGMAGYGIIVVDFDNKRVVSINDYSHPGSFFPRNPLLLAEGDPSEKSLLALLAEPEQWPHVALTVGPEMGFVASASRLVRGKHDPVQIEVVSLDQVIAKELDPQQALESITLSRDGSLKINGSPRMFLGAQYVPPGWTQQTDMGQEMPKCLLDILHDFKKAGFPPPQWEGVEEKLTQSYELPITLDDIETYLEGYCDDISELDPEELQGLQHMQQMGREFIALKEQWILPPVAKSSPRP